MNEESEYVMHALLKGERLTSEHINGELIWDLTGVSQNDFSVRPLIEAGYIVGKRDAPPLTYKTVWMLTDEGRNTAELHARMNAAKGPSDRAGAK